MLATRIIPCLDIKDGRVVKGTNFVNLKDNGDPVELATKYSQEGADELVFLDITASHEQRKTVIELASKLARAVYIPFTIGGGISDADSAVAIVKAGADKISLNSSAVKNPPLITECSRMLGAQCVVVAIDAKRREGQYNVFINGGRIDTGLEVVEWAKECQELGAGEILLTVMDADGTRNGFDNEITSKVSKTLSIPVIASGGAGEPAHFVDAVNIGCADAVLAAGIFHDNKYTIGEVKDYMVAKGLTIRI